MSVKEIGLIGPKFNKDTGAISPGPRDIDGGTVLVKERGGIEGTGIIEGFNGGPKW